MAVSVIQSQIRAVDPFASYNSNVVSRLTRVLTRNINCIHQQTDFDVTLNTTFPTTQLDIAPGILFISDILIEVTAPFTVDFMDADFYEPSTIPMDSTGEYLLTIKYEYAISQPPPDGKVVILKPDQYALFQASGSPYLLYKVVNVINNLGTYEIDSLTDQHSSISTIKRVYSELEERLISVEASLATGTISAIPNTLVVRDSNADIYANEFNGNLIGSADTLTTPRKIQLSGDMIGEANFDGSQDININTTISSLVVDREFNIVIDSTSGNFISFVDYLNGSPQEGDRILINEDQIITNKLNIPKGILFKFLKGKKFIIPYNYLDNQIAIFNDRVESEGKLLFELRHTGTITTAISFLGDDNHHENIVIDNTGIGSINDVFKIELNSAGNLIKGKLLRTDPIFIINSTLNDISGKISNDIVIRERDYFTFTSRDSLFGLDTIYGISYNNSSNTWIIVGTNGKLATSIDGISWTLQDMSTTFGADTIYDVAYDWLNFQWLAVGALGKAAISADGTSWSSITITGFTGTDLIYKIKYNEGLLIAVGSSGLLSISTDGINWTQQTSGFGLSNIRGIDKNNSSNLWVIVGDDGKLATSIDGISWTLQDMSIIFGTDIIYSVRYSVISDIWVAAGMNGIISTSYDGINWLRRYSGFGINTIYDIFNSTDKWIIGGENGLLSTSDF